MAEHPTGSSDRLPVALLSVVAAGAFVFLAASIVWPQEMADILTGK